MESPGASGTVGLAVRNRGCVRGRDVAGFGVHGLVEESKVRKLLALALLLCVPSVAGADTSFDHRTKDDPFPIATEEDVRVRGYKPGSHPGMPWTPELERTLEKESVDRFLSEKVQPEMEAGSDDMKVTPGMIINPEAAIVHYLKALVLVEEERLKREAK